MTENSSLHGVQMPYSGLQSPPRVAASDATKSSMRAFTDTRRFCCQVEAKFKIRTRKFKIPTASRNGPTLSSLPLLYKRMASSHPDGGAPQMILRPIPFERKALLVKLRRSPSDIARTVFLIPQREKAISVL